MIKIIKPLAVLALLTLCTKTNGQHTVLDDNGAWFTMKNKFKISKNFYASSFFQYRSVDFIKNVQYLFVGPGLGYNFNDNVSAGVGYTFITRYSSGANFPIVPKNEHRLWQRLTLKSKIRNTSLSNRFVFEERFKQIIVNDDDIPYTSGRIYSQRFRYRFDVSFNLFKLNNSKFLLGKVTNEIRIRFKSGISDPDFDQYNFNMYVGYNLLKHSKIWLGYGRDYYKINSNLYLKDNLLRLNFSYDFDFTKKEN